MDLYLIYLICPAKMQARPQFDPEVDNPTCLIIRLLFGFVFDLSCKNATQTTIWPNSKQPYLLHHQIIILICIWFVLQKMQLRPQFDQFSTGRSFKCTSNSFGPLFDCVWKSCSWQKLSISNVYRIQTELFIKKSKSQSKVKLMGFGRAGAYGIIRHCCTTPFA